MLTCKVTNNICKQDNRHKTELKINPLKTTQTLVKNSSRVFRGVCGEVVLLKYRPCTF